MRRQQKLMRSGARLKWDLRLLPWLLPLFLQYRIPRYRPPIPKILAAVAASGKTPELPGTTVAYPPCPGGRAVHHRLRARSLATGIVTCDWPVAAARFGIGGVLRSIHSGSRGGPRYTRDTCPGDLWQVDFPRGRKLLQGSRHIPRLGCRSSPAPIRGWPCNSLWLPSSIPLQGFVGAYEGSRGARVV